MATNTEKIVVQVVVQGDKQLDKLEKKTKVTTRSFAKMTAGVLSAVAAFRQINQIVSNAIRSFRDFEFQMAKVKAITNASERDFKRLSDTAQQLGRSTFFTAQQVAELQTNFGKLGFSTTEILQAQEATLNLATATDTDLARAAVVAGAAVRGFALDASETGRVTDVMASAFTSSALDIEKFQTSMTKVAPIAAGASISLEATTAVMGTLTDAGIEASIAGTSLRNIFLKMQDPASDLSKHLGFTVGSSEDLQRALQQLNADSLSNAEIMELVDLRQVAAFQTMVNGSERIAFLTEQFELSNGAAKDMADTVGDTLEGAFKRLTSAMQGLQIAALGEGGALTRFVNGLANLFNLITDNIAPQETQIELLQRTAQELDENFSILASGNLTERARITLIQKINTEYAEYLPNLISEKDTLKDIETMQLKVNDAMMENILMKQLQEELAELAERNATAIKAQANNSIELERIKQQQLSTDPAILATNKQIGESILLIDQRNKFVTDNFEKDKEILTKGYEDLAKSLGLNFENILKKLKATRDSFTPDEDGGGDLLGRTPSSIQAITLEQELQNQALRDYLDIMGLVLDKTMSVKDAEEALRLEKIQSIEDQLASLPVFIMDAETRLKLEKQLIDLKLKGLTDEEIKRKEQIGQMQQVGQQLITLAGNDEKYQKVRELGVRISAAAALANNAEALSLQMKGLSASLALGFPANLIAVASTLALLLSMKQNFQVLARGEQFANGGMVQGKSHAQGGEKFAVGGRVVELEGGEAVINKRSTAMFRNQLSAMNAAGGGVKFADGGLLNMPSFTQQQFNALGQTQMMGAMQGGRKVVVVEADITNAQDKVSVIESQATL